MGIRSTTLQRAGHMALCLFVSIFLWQGAAHAEGGLVPEDPMVRVTYVATDLDVDSVLASVSKDVSKATGLKESFITYYWQTFDTIVYEGRKIDRPLFVDLYVPGFFSDDDVQGLMVALADALEDHTGVDKKWIFIHTHFPLPGQVFISGGVTDWEVYRGKPNNAPRDISERALSKFLFNDAAFVFQSLWRFGLTATGGSDMGELLTITSQVKDFDKESWYRAWHSMAVKVRSMALEFATQGHAVSAREAYLRASNYFRASCIYMYNTDPRGFTAWKNGRDAFMKAAGLSNGRIKPVRIPYEKTTLQGYFVTPDNSGKKRPTLLIQTGLDGTAEDLYFIMGTQAARRGYNCLIFEGPGQGSTIQEQKIPFRYDWEKVVTPVVDFALKQPQVDAKRLALLGYSMGGYLVPRALAYEKRIRWGIVDSGVYSVFDGTMTKFPAEVRKAVEASKNKDTVNALAAKEMQAHPELNQFISQMLWTFQSPTPYDLFKKLQKFSLAQSIDKITAEMLVANSSHDQVAGSAEQGRIFYNALQAPKTFLEFDASQGGQFHCQLGAPMLSSERLLNWLDERAKP